MTKRCMTNSRLGQVAAALMILGLAAAGARAENQGGYAPPPTGLELTWARGQTASEAVKEKYHYRVIRADGEEALYLIKSKGKPDDRVHLFRSLFSYAYWKEGQHWVEYKFDRVSLRKLWPLAPGKETRVKMRFGYGEGKTIEQAKANWKETEAGEIHYRVLRREKVTVPAGTFDAFAIERVRQFIRHDGGAKTVERRVGWLVPKLGFVVKQNFHKNIGGSREKKFVIQVISVKRPSSAK